MFATLSTCVRCERRYCRMMTMVASGLLVVAFAVVALLSGVIVVRLYRGDH